MSETIDNIVREMRGYAEDMRVRHQEAVEGDKQIDCNIIAYRMREMAGRIERAHNREMADALDTGAFVAATRTRKDSLQVGNAAKMREALLMVKRLFDGRIMFQSDIRKAHKAVDAALAAPPRYCDKCNGPNEAVALAVNAGVVDCNSVAVKMAVFLFAEAVVSKTDTTTDIEEVIADLRESGAK